MDDDSCQECRFYLSINEGDDPIGKCHRYPPQIVCHGERGMFPAVSGGDICGEFEETKVEIPVYEPSYRVGEIAIVQSIVDSRVWCEAEVLEVIATKTSRSYGVRSISDATEGIRYSEHMRKK